MIAMMVVVFVIDLLVSVVEGFGALPTVSRRVFRENRVMVTRTRCNFSDTNDKRFGYNTSQSARLFTLIPRSWSS